MYITAHTQKQPQHLPPNSMRRMAASTSIHPQTVIHRK